MKENVFLNCAIKEIKKIGQAVKKVEKLMTKKDNSLWEGIKKKGNGVQEFPFVTLLIRGVKPNHNRTKVILKLHNNHYFPISSLNP